MFIVLIVLGLRQLISIMPHWDAWFRCRLDSIKYSLLHSLEGIIKLVFFSKIEKVLDAKVITLIN